jgi:hypothetical protein
VIVLGVLAAAVATRMLQVRGKRAANSQPATDTAD